MPALCQLPPSCCMCLKFTRLQEPAAWLLQTSRRGQRAGL